MPGRSRQGGQPGRGAPGAREKGASASLSKTLSSCTERGAGQRRASAQHPRRHAGGRRGELACITVLVFEVVKSLPAFPPRPPALSRVPRDSVVRVLMG